MNKILANICPEYVWHFLNDDTDGCAQEVKSQGRKEMKLGHRWLNNFFFSAVQNLILELAKNKLLRGKLN